ncbi:polygalacturonase [Vararia minispora EC-137]|uniref:Polygalacturonase n=1 Tax=Vararia minispora EC-137 TaxID=1314806 RepID=A0ACB8QEY6_9AGAM|nr:polygalacturonase [Vararia minispora EC-137]
MGILRSLVLLASVLSPFVRASLVIRGNVCTVVPEPDGGDDAPSIITAFAQCATDAIVAFQNTTYHIESVMATHGLRNVTVDLRGTLLWGTDIAYWRNNSLALGYQNQSVAWDFGGEDVTFVGHGFGTFDGNGQLWYDFTKGVSNLPGRPINFVLRNSTDFVMRGVRFVQSQFWTMAVFNASRVLMEDIFISSTSNSSQPARNTDGLDTFYTDNITLRNWTVHNGDDAVAPKANTSNMLLQDATFVGSVGFAIGSIGQYPGVYEFIENVTAERVSCTKCHQAAYVKTWTGKEVGVPPNGGGGGLGHARNITFRDFVVANLTQQLASITQCTTFSGTAGDCNSSLFQLSDVAWINMTGTVNTGNLAVLQCSGAAPCQGITISDVGGVVMAGDVLCN